MVRSTFLLLVMLAALPVPAQSLLALANDYKTALKRFENDRRSITLEIVFRKGAVLSDKYSELEKLSEPQYKKFVKTMRGFVVNREEVVFVEPDVNFFYTLARKKGRAVDKSFFKLLKEIKPDSVWAAYIEQQTDVTGCTIYGNGVLTKLYGKALGFKRNYPAAYKSYVKDEIDDVLQAFNPNICACGDRESAIREFGLFVKSYPRDKNTPGIKRTLNELKGNKNFRLYCHSG